MSGTIARPQTISDRHKEFPLFRKKIVAEALVTLFRTRIRGAFTAL